MRYKKIHHPPRECPQGPPGIAAAWYGVSISALAAAFGSLGPHPTDEDIQAAISWATFTGDNLDTPKRLTPAGLEELALEALDDRR